MSQMNLAQLVNLDQVQPSVQIAQSPVEYTQGGVSGGQVQVGDPGVILTSYAPVDSQASMFFALSEIARGVQTGLNNFDQIATHIEKGKIQDADNEFNNISNDEKLTPDQKEEKMNEYLREINTPYLGNRWRQNLNNNMEKYWKSTEAQTQFYNQKWEEFLANAKLKDPSFLGTEEQLAPKFTEFYNLYPNARNIPRIVNEETKNDAILTARKIKEHEDMVFGATRQYLAQAMPDAEALNNYISGLLTQDQIKEMDYQYSFFMPIVRRFMDDPKVTNQDLAAMIQGQYDELFWKPYMLDLATMEGIELHPTVVANYRQLVEPLITEQVRNLNTFTAKANRERIHRDSGNTYAILESTGTSESYRKGFPNLVGNLDPKKTLMPAILSFPVILKGKLDTENPKIGNKRWSDLGPGEQIQHLRKLLTETSKQIVDGKKLGDMFIPYVTDGWENTTRLMLLDKDKGFGTTVDLTVNRSLENIKQISTDFATGIKDQPTANVAIMAQIVTLDKFLSGSEVKTDGKGNPTDSMLLGLVYDTDKDGNRTVNYTKNIETWVEELRTKQPEVYARLEATGLLSAQNRDLLSRIQEGLRSAYRELQKTPEQRSDPVTGDKKYIEAEQRQLNLLDAGKFIEAQLAKMEQDKLIQEKKAVPASTIAMAKSYETAIKEGEAFEKIFDKQEGWPGFPNGIYYDDKTARPLSKWPTLGDWQNAKTNGWVKDNGDLTADGQRAYARTFYKYQTQGRLAGQNFPEIETEMNRVKEGLRGLYTKGFFRVVKEDPAQAYFALAVVSGLSSSDPRGTRLNTIMGEGVETLTTVSLLTDQFRKYGVIMPSLSQLDDTEKALSVALSMAINRITSQGSGNMTFPNWRTTKFTTGYPFQPYTPAEAVRDLSLSFDPNNQQIWNAHKEIAQTLAQSFNSRDKDGALDYPSLYRNLSKDLGLPDWDENIEVSYPGGKVNWKDQDPEWKIMYATGKYLEQGPDYKTFLTMVLGIPSEGLGTFVDRELLFKIGPGLLQAYSVDGGIGGGKTTERQVEYDAVTQTFKTKDPNLVRDGLYGIKRSQLLEAAYRLNYKDVKIAGTSQPKLGSTTFSYEVPWLTKFQTRGWTGDWGIEYISLDGKRSIIKGQFVRTDNENPNSPAYTPETESEFIIDKMISIPLDTDSNQSYGFYTAVAKDLGKTPLDQTEYNVRIAQFRNDAKKENRVSQYRNSASPSLWEFMLLNHDVDLTGLVDEKDNRRNIVVEDNGYLTIRIPGVEGKFKLDTLVKFSGFVAKSDFATTSEYDAYVGATREQRQRLLAHRIYKNHEEPKINAEKERKENLTTFVVSDYSGLETQEQPSQQQTSFGIITSNEPNNPSKQQGVFYKDLPLAGSLRKQDKGYFGDFEIIDNNNEKVVVREFPIWTSFSTKDGSINLEIPILVPTLTSDEVLKVLESAKKNKMPPTKIIAKAKKHALDRIKNGLSPFYVSENNTSFSYNKQRIQNLQKQLFE